MERRQSQLFNDTKIVSVGVHHADFFFWSAAADATRLAAPLLPLATEAIWRGLTGGRSVHLTDWPAADDLPADTALVAAMDEVQEVCSVASSVRKANKLRVRLPLPGLTVASPTAEQLTPYRDLIADEMNVKSVSLAALACHQPRRQGQHFR